MLLTTAVDLGLGDYRAVLDLTPACLTVLFRQKSGRRGAGRPVRDLAAIEASI